jgi:hypothetical protein
VGNGERGRTTTVTSTGSSSGTAPTRRAPGRGSRSLPATAACWLSLLAALVVLLVGLLPVLLKAVLLETVLFEAVLLETVLFEAVLLETVLLKAVLLETVFPGAALGFVLLIFTHVRLLCWSGYLQANLTQMCCAVQLGQIGGQEFKPSQFGPVALGF